MANTNVDYYAAGFDKDGKRVCSLICDFNPDKHADKKAELLDKVKATSDNIEIAEIIAADDFVQYLDGKVRDAETGRPIDYVAPEPTAEEKAAAEKAQIDSDYNASVAALQASMQIAQLNNDADAIASIQAEKASLDAAYKGAIATAEGSDK